MNNEIHYNLIHFYGQGQAPLKLHKLGKTADNQAVQKINNRLNNLKGEKNKK